MDHPSRLFSLFIRLLLMGMLGKGNHNPNSNQCFDVDPTCALYQEITDAGYVREILCQVGKQN